MSSASAEARRASACSALGGDVVAVAPHGGDAVDDGAAPEDDVVRAGIRRAPRRSIAARQRPPARSRASTSRAVSPVGRGAPRAPREDLAREPVDVRRSPSRLAVSGAAARRRRARQQIGRVGEPVEPLRARLRLGRRADSRPCASAISDAGQVAAVDGRDVSRDAAAPASTCRTSSGSDLGTAPGLRAW